jgi:hypothetical protein
MKRTQLNFHLIVAVLSIAVTGCSSVAATDRYATGEVGGDRISSPVDSEIARYFLEEYLPDKRTNPEWDQQIDGFLKAAKKRPFTNEELEVIADQTSVDFAAMLFAETQTERHRTIKETFLTQYRLVQQGLVSLEAATQRYKILLVPGLFYQSKPETKGDLREVRAMLLEAGFEVVSIPILEAGTVEQNAKIIADFVRGEPTNGKELILVSTSKGGPDTAYALGHLMDEEAAKKVAVWFSVGGVLRGSPLADQWTSWPRRWIAATVGVFAGFSVDMVRSLSVERSLERME